MTSESLNNKLASTSSEVTNRFWCTQMFNSVTRWWDHFSIFGLYNHENLANTYTKIAKVGSKSCQILTNSKNIAKYLYIFAKAAKIRRIWSHWSLKASESFYFFQQWYLNYSLQFASCCNLTKLWLVDI